MREDCRLTVEAEAVEADEDWDAVLRSLFKLVAAFGGLVRRALVLDILAGGASNKILGGGGSSHDGEGDKGDDALDLHFGCWRGF